MRKGYRRSLDRLRGQLDLWLLGAAGQAARVLRLRRLYFSYLARLVHRTGLFDETHYLETNPDVQGEGMHALIHYVRYGDREGRQPTPLFDPLYYRAHAPGAERAPNSLLHYCLLGRHHKISTSAWFDVEFYLRQNRDVARLGADPLRHYLEWGGSEGRSPCRQFDGAFYLQDNPQVAEAGINPLVHYLRFGRFEGRPVLEYDETGRNRQLAEVSDESAAEAWSDLEPRAACANAQLDVIVPVYKGRAETMRCLLSVLRARCETPFELVVIDDCSPDQGLVALLRRHAEAGLFTLLRNEHNLGFVRTVNRGMELHPERDVILLNSDTEVYGDWLDRLRGVAGRDPSIATVTPLSNNATIASYPRFVHDNPYPLELAYAELDALAASTNQGVQVEAPTGVGFCMYLRRAAIAELGSFDAEAFGRGYGEENDFCQRAIAAGWRNVISAEVFVRHLGSVSFQGERAKRVVHAMRVMARRYPSYDKDVRRFIEEDPLASARRNLDLARLKAKSRARNVLIVCHNRGGGAERHVREDTSRLLAEGRGVFFLRPVHGRPSDVRISHPDHMQLPNLPSYQFGQTRVLAPLLRELRIDHVHNHGMVDFTANAPDDLVRLVRAIDATLDVDVHDYKVICPRLNLSDDSGRYCGEPDEKGCDNCLSLLGNKFGARSIREWRAAHARMLGACETVWVPDPDVSTRLAHYFPGTDFAIAPHESIDAATVRINKPAIRPGEPLRVTVIGAIGKVKGFEVLLECARLAQSASLPLRFSLLGYSMNDQRLIQAGVEVSGRYLEAEGESRLRAQSTHIAWLPSLWPETYSYTLSLALMVGLPVFAFDIGAISRRLAELGMADYRMPLSLASDPQAVNRVFLDYRDTLLATVPDKIPDALHIIQT